MRAEESTPSQRRIWIAWETQRRSLTLSKRVGAELHIFDLEHLGWARYPISALRTSLVLFHTAGGVVFVQNPSMLLAMLAVVLKPFLRYTLIVDRHSNFLLGNEPIGVVTRGLLNWMSRFTIRHADITIVTNSDLVEKHFQQGGRPFILPDPYPDVPRAPRKPRVPGGPLKVFFVSSWEVDEPIREAMEACRRLGPKLRVCISGRPKPAYDELLKSRPDNFVPTGFISDEEYFRLMSQSDCVLAVTRWPGTLCCGAYEGVAMGKPIIVNNEGITRSYFQSGACYTDGSADDLVRQFQAVSNNLESLSTEVTSFFAQSDLDWNNLLRELEHTIQRIRTPDGKRPTGLKQEATTHG